MEIGDTADREVCGTDPMISPTFNRNHAVGGAPPSRRLTAWAIRKGDWQATVFDHCAVNSLRHGNGAQHPHSDGLSRRDGGAPTAWIRFNHPCRGCPRAMSGRVAQTSKSAVSQGFQPAGRPSFSTSAGLATLRRLEIGDTADWEVCATISAACRGVQRFIELPIFDSDQSGIGSFFPTSLPSQFTAPVAAS